MSLENRLGRRYNTGGEGAPQTLEGPISLGIVRLELPKHATVHLIVPAHLQSRRTDVSNPLLQTLHSNRFDTLGGNPPRTPLQRPENRSLLGGQHLLTAIFNGEIQYPATPLPQVEGRGEVCCGQLADSF